MDLIYMLYQQGRLVKINPFCVDVDENSETLKEGENSLSFAGKNDAGAALHYRRNSMLQHACTLQNERLSKEAFILRSLKQMSQNTIECNSKTTPNQSSRNIETSSSLTVANVRQRVVGFKWVICITVSNDSRNSSIVDPKLYLNFPPQVPSIQSEIKFFRIVNRRPKHVSETKKNTLGCGTFVEEITNRMIGPGKRRFILAVMDLPVCALSLVTIKGLLTHGKYPHVFRTQLLPMTLNLDEINASIAFPFRDAGKGVSSDLICLVATLKKSTFKVHSSVFSFSDFSFGLTSMGMKKVPVLDEFFVFDSAGPLCNSVLTFQTKSNKEMTIHFYTRDYTQSILLLHAIRKILPADTRLTHLDDVQSMDHKSRNQFNTIFEGAEMVYEAIQNGISDKTDICGGSKRPRENVIDGLSTNDYYIWRYKLHNIQTDMELNCF